MSTTSAGVRSAGIDLLRGIAIGLVLVRHALPGIFPGAGIVGVVMFFALSGYLITGVLVAEHERTGHVSLRRFYLRRARRLVPALVVVVLAIVVVTLTWDPLGDRSELPRTVLVALTWTGNLPFDQGSDATFHLWTLATEEQFYLLWPITLLTALAADRVRTALLAVVAVWLIGCAATLVWLWPYVDLAYALPTSWIICFAIGGTARLYGERWPRATAAEAALAVTVLLALSALPLRGHTLTYLVGGPTVAALTVLLLLRWRDCAFPAWEPLIWLGTVSYGAYLWNYPLTLWLRAAGHDMTVAGLLALALTLVAAAASWRWVERPFLARTTPVRVSV